MEPSTVTTETFKVTISGTTPVLGVVAYDSASNSATFVPTDNLAFNTRYSAIITVGAEDLAGNPVANDFEWTFTTDPSPPGEDSTAPTVSATVPADGTMDVAINQKIVVSFSEALSRSSIDGSIALVGPDRRPVTGAFVYNDPSHIATFTPENNLRANTFYTATITNQIEDLAGNTLAKEVVWSFMTGVGPDRTAPVVNLTSPINGASGVAIDTTITATFSEGMDPSTITDEIFTLSGAGGTNAPGDVAYDALGSTASFTPEWNLALGTNYTATISAAAQDLAGNALTVNKTWTFMTTASPTFTGTPAPPDTTLPTVTTTSPLDAAVDVAINSHIATTFSEPMNPSTVIAANFTLEGPNSTFVSGDVTYATVGNTATFTPDADLDFSTSYTATVTTALEDLGGNALALDETWTFTTAAPPDTTLPTVTATSPLGAAVDVAINSPVTATFSEPMNASTVIAANFTLEGPNSTIVSGTVSYDAPSQITSFVPLSDLAWNTAYVARITTETEDLAGNNLASDFVWSFTTTNAPSGVLAVNLRSLSSFAVVAGAGLTNFNSAGDTTINGDVGLSPTATCTGDGVPCTTLNPIINGTLYANDAGGVAAAAKADLTLAYNDAAGRPPGTTVGNLSGLVLAPGIYTSASTMLIDVGATLTLDAQGNANEVWIFQIGSSITVNDNVQVLLINGARASNVYWAMAASATIGANTIFKGNVMSVASNTVGSGSTVEGRLFCSDGTITLESNTITTPIP